MRLILRPSLDLRFCLLHFAHLLLLNLLRQMLLDALLPGLQLLENRCKWVLATLRAATGSRLPLRGYSRKVHAEPLGQLSKDLLFVRASQCRIPFEQLPDGGASVLTVAAN